MALKITLKPHEKVIIGGAVITNGDLRSHLIIENRVPILRQKDILAEAEASSPCRRIYFVIQLMYVDEPNLATYHEMYWKLVKELVEAAPSTLPSVGRISESILSGNHYQALKEAKRLISYEKEVIDRVYKSSGNIPVGQQDNHVGPGDRSRGSHQGRLQAQGVPG
jgi:flagellar protein FlbT